MKKVVTEYVELQNDRDAEVPPSLRELLWRWGRRAAVVGVLVSVVVHILMALMSMLIGWGGPAGPGRVDSEGPGVEFAVASEEELASLQDSAVALDAPAVPEMSMQEPVAADLMDASAASGLEGAIGEISDIGTLAGGGDVGTSGEAMGGAGGGGASFFGVEATGNRFVYIVDVSQSMGFGGRIERLRDALGDSISGLPEVANFLVLAYSSDTHPLGGRSSWTEAVGSGKRWALTEINKLQPIDMTRPLGAFQVAMGMRPRPDAIYFMTDGEFENEDILVQEISLLNAKLKVPIHCICFGTQASEKVMKQIAALSKGSYTFIAGPP
ncbi:MAG: hypothetical protein AB7Q00_05380 [Phycisphaerales bacterium]